MNQQKRAINSKFRMGKEFHNLNTLQFYLSTIPGLFCFVLNKRQKGEGDDLTRPKIKSKEKVGEKNRSQED